VAGKEEINALSYKVEEALVPEQSARGTRGIIEVKRRSIHFARRKKQLEGRRKMMGRNS